MFLDQIGCRLNEAEVAGWRRDLARRGHAPVPRLEDADVAVFNSCAVTAEAARQSRKHARRLHRRNPRARLVLTGCFATLEPEAAADLAGVDLVVPNADKDRLVELLLEGLEEGGAPAAAREPAARLHPSGGRTRAFVKIQDGCRNRCTFCIVTAARGEERSRPIAAIVDEIAALHAGGCLEAVLTGVHIGGYGSDLGTTLRDLLDALVRETTIPRLRLGSLEPWDVPDDLFDRWAACPRLMPHLHLPLQSGSDAVLRRMGRRCPADRYRALVARARAAIPDLHLTTDLIVGFPGETDDDHARTLDLLAELRFGHVHTFAYSPRPGTAAAGFADPVPRVVQKQRSADVHAVAARLQAAALQARVGETRPVLFEGRTHAVVGGWSTTGYTDTFQRVAVTLPTPRRLAGQLLPVRLTEALQDHMRGTFA